MDTGPIFYEGFLAGQLYTVLIFAAIGAIRLLRNRFRSSNLKGIRQVDEQREDHIEVKFRLQE